MLDQIQLQLDREGIKGREDGERGGGGGDYSRRAFKNISTQEGRLIKGRLLFEEIRYFYTNVVSVLFPPPRVII